MTNVSNVVVIDEFVLLRVLIELLRMKIVYHLFDVLIILLMFQILFYFQNQLSDNNIINIKIINSFNNGILTCNGRSSQFAPKGTDILVSVGLT